MSGDCGAPGAAPDATPDHTLEAALDAALAATWPAVETRACGPFVLRRGGGGRRCRAATLATGAAPPGASEIARAAARMERWDQTPLFRLRGNEAAFDRALEAAGYRSEGATILFTAPSAPLAAATVPRVTTFDLWPPLAIQETIWADGGIGRDRRAVMDRVAGAKTALFGRAQNRPAGVAFAALHGQTAMVHALHVRPAARRLGLAGHMMAHAARWAHGLGARRIAAAAETDNAAALAVFGALGMVRASGYHYRHAPGDRDA